MNVLQVRGEVEIMLLDGDIPSALLQKYCSHNNLSTEEREFLRSRKQLRYRTPNMLMTRFLDRLSSVFSHGQVGSFFTTGPATQYNVDQFQNMMVNQALWGYSAGAGGNDGNVYNTVPELIGLGYDTTAPTPEDRGLLQPYNDSYRNTWNMREGGTGPGTLDNYLFRCGTTWDTSYVPADWVNQIGLFFNYVYTSQRRWLGASPVWTIDFTGEPPFGAMVNRAWEILNICEVTDSTLGSVPYVIKLYRRDTADPAGMTYDWSETTQIITYTGVLGNPPEPMANNDCLIFFSPRYDHLGDVQGCSLNFSPPPAGTDMVNLPQMYARVALPTPIEKLATNTLVIVWMIYLEEYEP